MTKRVRLLISSAVVLVVSFTGSGARAEQAPCEDVLAGATPVRVPLGPADVGVQPEACPSTMVALEGRGAALVATEDFYGNLLAGAAVRGRVAVGRRGWVSFMVPGIDHRFAANATVEATRTSLGAGSLGGHLALRLVPSLALAPFVRVLIPTETAFDRATRTGFDHGISAMVPLGGAFSLVGGYDVALLATTGAGRTHLLLLPSVVTDVVYRPWRAFAIAAGAGLRFAPIDPRPFESFDPRLSLRFFPHAGLFATLSATAPLSGRDRTDLGAALSVGWDFGG